MHHVDLGLGYRPVDWSVEYVTWELPLTLAALPTRLAGHEEAAQLLAGMTGRVPGRQVCSWASDCELTRPWSHAWGPPAR